MNVSAKHFRGPSPELLSEKSGDFTFHNLKITASSASPRAGQEDSLDSEKGSQPVGTLTGVGPDVTLEQPGPGEGLPAGATHAGQRVASDVHLEGTQADVFLVAVFAVEGLAGLGVLGSGEPNQLLGQWAQAWEGSITLGLQGRG